MTDTSPLVSVQWLADRLGSSDLLVLDARSELGAPERSAALFETGHIASALPINVDTDLSAPAGDGSAGARPLPDPGVLAARLGALGVDASAHLVVYDETTGIAAARAWWVLKAMGIARISVLDGGLKAWLAAGNRLETGPRAPRPATSVSLSPPVGVMDFAATSALAAGPLPGTVLVDARGAAAYAGDGTSPSHLPGAINLPAAALLAPDGRMLPPAALLEELAPIADAEMVVAHCGSGVSACGLLLGMAAAGIETGRLYPGGWSEWTKRSR